MTRNEQPAGLATYDDDFFTWTKEQAAALRLAREAFGGSVDIEHVAEEIEDLGKRDLREVSSFLSRLIEHLLKLQAASTSRDGAHWWSEATHFQSAAAAAYTPGMRQLLKIDRIWASGRKAAGKFLRDIGAPPEISPSCPFTAEDLLSHDFDIDAALAKLAAARDTPRP